MSDFRQDEGFMVFARSKGLIHESYGLQSVASGTDLAWLAWQAARAQPVQRDGGIYSQGICGDGAAILKNGQPMTVDEIVASLNAKPVPDEEWGNLFADVRDDILHGFNSLDGVLDNDQTNAVLDAVDRLDVPRAVPVPSVQHPDDEAVNQFAAMLKSKLAKARAKGRDGWREPSWTAADINRQMHEHAAKGDPLDVAAYAMFLALRGEATTAPQAEHGKAVAWPNYKAAISDPLFHQARGIMGTQNYGQDEALRQAILHVIGSFSPAPDVPSGTVTGWLKRDGQTIYTVATAGGPVIEMVRADETSTAPVALKGIGRINGDGWKDTTTIGQVVFVWNAELPKPYAPGQFPRIGNSIWSASRDQYDFAPATAVELREFVEACIEQAAAPRPADPTAQATPKVPR